MIKIQAVLKMVSREIDEAGSLRKLAEAWGISAAYLSDVMLERRLPGPAILGKMGLRVRKTVSRVYEKERPWKPPKSKPRSEATFFRRSWIRMASRFAQATMTGSSLGPSSAAAACTESSMPSGARSATRHEGQAKRRADTHGEAPSGTRSGVCDGVSLR